jgi:hypothetical protein
MVRHHMVIEHFFTFRSRMARIGSWVGRLRKPKLDLARLNLEELYKAISQPDYQATIPEAVQLGNEERVSSPL